MTSSTTLALGTSAGSLLVAIAVGVVMGALGMYNLHHNWQVFAWMRKMRHKDEENAELSNINEWIDDLYKAQCALAQKPCHAADFEEVARTCNMIKGMADHFGFIRPELTHVVGCAEGHIATALPELGPDTEVSLAEHRAQLVRAMKQEAARAELARAVITAQQKIKSLRRS
ncbi:hypothetical protein [Streptomyces sp. NPDC002537]